MGRSVNALVFFFHDTGTLVARSGRCFRWGDEDLLVVPFHIVDRGNRRSQDRLGGILAATQPRGQTNKQTTYPRRRRRWLLGFVAIHEVNSTLITRFKTSQLFDSQVTRTLDLGSGTQAAKTSRGHHQPRPDAARERAKRPEIRRRGRGNNTLPPPKSTTTHKAKTQTDLP